MNYSLSEIDFYKDFTVWLTLIAEYEEDYGKEIEDIKISYIINPIIGPLASHLKLSPNLNDFDRFCELCHNYYAPTKNERDNNNKQSDGINALSWRKDGKGKGKGKINL